jgi:hypothetical protein
MMKNVTLCCVLCSMYVFVYGTVRSASTDSIVRYNENVIANHDKIYFILFTKSDFLFRFIHILFNHNSIQMT